MRIGLPRVLIHHYRFLPLFAGFFRELGLEVVISPPTRKDIMRRGIDSTVDDACLPLKVAFGHLFELLESGVDRIFLPRLVSLEPGSSLCPKIIGLPDMALSCVNAGLPLLSPTADINRGRGGLLETLEQSARELGFSEEEIDRALSVAETAQAAFHTECLAGRDPEALLRSIETGEPYVHPVEGDELEIRVVGRSYLIFDAGSCLDILAKLRAMGCRVLTHEAVDHATQERELAGFKRTPYWTLSREILGAAGFFLRQSAVDGLVFVPPFQCGPASLLETLIESLARKHPQTGFTTLVLDEHTGEAGLMTRLEAFLDMIRRRKLSR